MNPGTWKPHHSNLPVIRISHFLTWIFRKKILQMKPDFLNFDFLHFVPGSLQTRITSIFRTSNTICAKSQDVCWEKELL